jgi:hypothetical protein
VTGIKDGKGRKMIMEMPKAKAKRLIGKPQRSRRNRASVGTSPRHLAIMKNKVDIMWDRYYPSVDRD